MTKPKSYLGIDPSTSSTGYGVLGEDGELLAWGAIAPDKKTLTDAECLNFQAQAISEVLQNYDIQGVVCEDQFQGPNSLTYKQLCRISGGFILLAGMMDIRIEIMTPGQWRKATHGKGNVDKKFTQKWVNETYDKAFLVKHNDITDAIGIAYACRELFRGELTDESNEKQQVKQ